jgi:hypothetical protein
MTVGATNTGETSFQVATLEIVIDDFSYDRPVESVIFDELLVIINTCYYSVALPKTRFL